MNYYVITFSEDGDVRIYPFTRQGLLSALTPNETSEADFDVADVMPELSETDPARWHGQFLVIKGEIVNPIPRKTVIEFDLP